MRVLVDFTYIFLAGSRCARGQREVRAQQVTLRARRGRKHAMQHEFTKQ